MVRTARAGRTSISPTPTMHPIRFSSPPLLALRRLRVLRLMVGLGGRDVLFDPASDGYVLTPEETTVRKPAADDD